MEFVLVSFKPVLLQKIVLITPFPHSRFDSKIIRSCGTYADGLLVSEGNIRTVVSISALTCRNDNSVLSSYMTYHRVCNKSNTMGVTSEAETATLP